MWNLERRSFFVGLLRKFVKQTTLFFFFTFLDLTFINMYIKPSLTWTYSHTHIANVVNKFTLTNYDCWNSDCLQPILVTNTPFSNKMFLRVLNVYTRTTNQPPTHTRTHTQMSVSNDTPQVTTGFVVRHWSMFFITNSPKWNWNLWFRLPLNLSSLSGFRWFHIDLVRRNGIPCVCSRSSCRPFLGP